MHFRALIFAGLLFPGCLMSAPAERSALDSCHLLFNFWGVRARDCGEKCNSSTVYIVFREEVRTPDGEKVLGLRRGNYIEIDRTESRNVQLTVTLHEIGHVLLGSRHSKSRDDILYAKLRREEAPKYPSPREYIFARELYRGESFRCKLIP